MITRCEKAIGRFEFDLPWHGEGRRGIHDCAVDHQSYDEADRDSDHSGASSVRECARPVADEKSHDDDTEERVGDGMGVQDPFFFSSVSHIMAGLRVWCYGGRRSASAGSRASINPAGLG